MKGLMSRQMPPLWWMTVGLIFFVNPFVDALTGLIVLSDESEVGGLGSPSQLFRLLLSVVMLFQIKRRGHLVATLLFIIYLICLELFNFLFHNDVAGLLVGITYSYKTAFGLLMYFVLSRYISKGWMSVDKLFDCVIYSGAIYSGMVLLSDLLGISYASYMDTNLGSRGVFASANGLGIYVGVCSLIAIYRYVNVRKVWILWCYFLMAYVLLGLMTRAGIGLLVVGLLVWYMQISWRLKLPILGLVAVLVLIFWEPVSTVVEGATSVIAYRFEHAEVSFQGLVIGGRQNLFDRATENFTAEGPLWYRYLVGGGYFLSYRNPFNIAYQYSPILEADLWDIFYMFGAVGILSYFGLFIYGLTRKASNDVGGYILKVAWVMLFFHSAFAGHVIQNGMSIMIMVSLLLLIRYRDASNMEMNLDGQRVL